MSNLVGRLIFLSVHSVLHVVGYVLPRFICRLVLGKPRGAYDAGERSIIVIGSIDVARRFGLETSATIIDKDVHVLKRLYNAPLYNCHLNTLLTVFQATKCAAVSREVIVSYDECRVCLDWLYPPQLKREDVRGVLLLLPGITGNSSANYIVATSITAHRRGFAVVVLNPRGVAGTPLDRPQLYSAIFTHDVRFVLRRHLQPEQLAERFNRAPEAPALPIIGCGFSLGGMILSHYALQQAQAREPSYLRLMFSVNSPIDVPLSNEAMSTPISRYLYNWPLVYLLRSVVLSHIDVLAKMPGVDVEKVFVGTPVEKPKLSSITRIKDFDNLVTGPHFGFSGADDYYQHADLVERLAYSETPMVLLACRDDPICGIPSLSDYQKLVANHKGGMVILECQRGGHVGFLSSPLAAFSQEPNVMQSLLMSIIESYLAS